MTASVAVRADQAQAKCAVLLATRSRVRLSRFLSPAGASLTLSSVIGRFARLAGSARVPSLAQVAELVDALVSGTSGAILGGSSPLLGTTLPERHFTRCIGGADSIRFRPQTLHARCSIA